MKPLSIRSDFFFPKNQAYTYLIYSLLFLFASLPILHSQSIFNPAEAVYTDGITYHVFSTGHTTGKIAAATFINSNQKEVKVILYPAFIPSSRGYQSYVLPDTNRTIIPPGESLTIYLRGYCANPFQNPVPAGKAMPDFSEWVFPQSAFENRKLDRQKLWEDQILPAFEFLKSQISDTIYLINPIEEGCLPVNLYPSKLRLLVGNSEVIKDPIKSGGFISSLKICLDENDKIAAHLLLDAIISIESLVYEDGFIHSIPPEMRTANYQETFSQIALWKYSSGLILKSFTRKILFSYIFTQLESFLGKGNVPLLFPDGRLDDIVDLYYDKANETLVNSGLCY